MVLEVWRSLTRAERWPTDLRLEGFNWGARHFQVFEAKKREMRL